MGLILGKAAAPALSPLMAQGALSGGGFNKFISMSDDGLTKVMNYDGANAWVWNDSNSKWDLALSQSRVPGSAYNAAYRDWGRLSEPQSTFNGYAGFYTTASIVVAPNDKDRLYAIVWSFPRYSTPGRIWKSTDRAQSWTDTGYSVTPALHQSAVNKSHGYGAIMAVDPVNADIVFVSGAAGDIWKTTDGFGSTFDCLSGPGQPLDGSMPYVSVNSYTGGLTFTLTVDATPDAVVHKDDLSNRSMYFTNLTTPSSILGENVVNGSATTSTTITSLYPSDATINANDIVMIGEAGVIVFDRSSYVSGDHTPGIYIGWGYGAGAVWHSDDGGTSWAETAAGGPATALQMACTTDGKLFVVDNIAHSQGGWMLSGGIWTQLSITSSSSNPFNTVACDPTNSNRIVFATLSGDIKVTLDGGSTWFAPTPAVLRTATDVPWMKKGGTLEDSMTNGMMMFDPQVSGLLWTVEGIGCHTTTCPSSSSDTVTWDSKNTNQQGFIVDQIVKPPGYPLVMVGQDRVGFRITDVTQEPQPEDCFRGPWLAIANGFVDDGSGSGNYSGVSGNVVTVTGLLNGKNLTNSVVTDDDTMIGLHTGKGTTGASPLSANTYSLSQSRNIAPTTLYFTFNAPISHAWAIDYAQADPSFLVNVTGLDVWKSIDSGLNWLICARPTGFNFGGAIACQSSDNFVWFPGRGGTPSYTADGGVTWAACLFGGSSITSGWGTFTEYVNRHHVVADPADPDTYYSYNFSGTVGVGGWWVSVDGGANWTLQSGTLGVCGVSASDDFMATAVRGYSGHLLCAEGSAWQTNGAAHWSGDGGATWTDIPGMDKVWMIAAGKAAPSGIYPALFALGVPSATTDATQTPGVFRADGFDPNNPTADLTWVRYYDADGHTCPGGNMDGPKTLCADWEEHGTFYGGFQGTGYFYGKLS